MKKTGVGRGYSFKGRDLYIVVIHFRKILLLFVFVTLWEEGRRNSSDNENGPKSQCSKIPFYNDFGVVVAVQSRNDTHKIRLIILRVGTNSRIWLFEILPTFTNSSRFICRIICVCTLLPLHRGKKNQFFF